MRIARHNLTSASILVFILLSVAIRAEASLDQGQPLFESDSTLTLKLEAPFDSLLNELRNADEYVEGTLHIMNDDGTEQSMPVSLKPRGKTRRDKRFCHFPPLTIKFKEKSAEGTFFGGQKKLKLVTHCKNRSATYEQYYIVEYLIYKTYNLLTDASFDVRSAKVDYVDTQGKQSVSDKFAFFIENTNHLAIRTGLERREVEKTKISELDGKASSLVSVFQYMIGNLDWSLLGGPVGENCCHNAKLFLTATGETIPVPYDFDHAGVINAKYATPPEGSGTKNVRERLFRGFCRHNDDVALTLQLFKDNKPQIYGLIQDSELLRTGVVSSATRYYNRFYQIIENPDMTKKVFYDGCRGKL